MCAFDEDREEESARRALLKFKKKGHVPETVVESFVESATNCVQNSINLIKTGIHNNLGKSRNRLWEGFYAYIEILN